MNMPIERTYATSHELAMLVPYVTSCEIFTVKMYIALTLTLTSSMEQGQMQMPIESQCRTFSSMVNVIFTLSAKFMRYSVEILT